MLSKMAELSWHGHEKILSAFKWMYRINPNNWDTLTPSHICLKIWTHPFDSLSMCLKSVEWVAKSVDLDQMPHSAASDLGLYRLLSMSVPMI